MITIDMPKARDIWKDKIREERKPKLEKLDVEFMRAVEADDTAKKSEIATKKQALRDATSDPAIEAAATPEALKQVWPAALDDD